MQISKQDEWLDICLQRSEAVYSLRRQLTVHKKDIISIVWYESFQDWPAWHLRLPGTYLPGSLMAGSYYSPVGWDFIYAQKPKGWTHPKLESVIVITTRKNRFRRIILSETDDMARSLGQWLKK